MNKRWRAEYGEQYFKFNPEKGVVEETEAGWAEDDANYLVGNYYSTYDAALRGNEMRCCLAAFDVERGIPVEHSNMFLAWDDESLMDVIIKYGEKHHIRAAIGNNPRLDLSEGQTVCAGGEGYHFVLTEKRSQL